ncbi:MAG: urate hydroxylase PuuD [Pseudomonadales bacterium]|nr:urate hydroxylase PuuD [Pseudomonadales bacterium]
MEAHLFEWFNLALRWVHVIVGIAWIGASFYFVWLENNLDRQVKNQDIAGELWAIHGGGIYHLQKYNLAPATMPEHLHWFKWEAYSSWITGVLLLSTVYYLNAATYLLLPGSSISPMLGVAIGLGSLLMGWWVYDLLCKSPLKHQPLLLGVVLMLFLVGLSWGFSQFMTGRAAYLHVGAVIGTMMVGNVFFIIMPAQRNLVGAIEAGTEPDPALPKNGLLRSRHNNYLTLPVIFIMVSGHFPSTYGHEWNWAILLGLSIISVAVRHYFNTRHNSQRFVWALPAAVLALLVMAYVTAPSYPSAKTSSASSAAAETSVSALQAQAIVAKHCVSCHSATPSHVAFSAAPGGVMFDSIEAIKRYKDQIYLQTVANHIMPLGNSTGMTQDERDQLGRWIADGANIK